MMGHGFLRASRSGMALSRVLLTLMALAAVTSDCSRAPHVAPVPVRSVTPGDAPYVLVLGTAQDGGLPQLGCEEAPCRAARSDPALRRLVASLLVCDPRDGRRWLIDASPDLREQVALAAGHPASRKPAGPRPPLFDGIFLTHAHVGHYLGLAQLGREVYGATAMPVHATERACAFLEGNGPWNQLVRIGNIVPTRLTPGEPVLLAPDLSVMALLVPHRDEYSDTVGFVIRGPSRALFYVPDIDKWDRWEQRIEDVLDGVDVALLDGTFFADGEVLGRSMSDIPHPFIVETLERLGVLADSERRKVVFTHLNHTNPAALEGEARRRVTAAGMSVAAEGDLIRL